MKNNVSGRSCSTMVAVSSATKDSNVIFGKNSDRAVNEAQPLCFYPARDHEEGNMVKCTYISIPQAKHTYACIGSRPYNIFGFEHGINECGVMIGNEAVFGKELPEIRRGLLGMDILRLALERSDSAAKAVEVMGHLLETYGTGGDPGSRVPYFNANYIIADTKESYMFESCQRYWAAKKVESTGHLSNCYSLGDDYDLIGKDVADQVIRKGWAPKSDKINIAAAFTNDDGNYDWAEGYFRYCRQHQLMNNHEPFTVKMMMENLRDHYSEEMRNCLPYGIAAAKFPTICCHPAGINGCVTAASAVCTLNDKAPDPFRFVYWGCMAPPCCSIYRPLFNINWIPEELEEAGELYDEKSQWWTFIELERYIALNYELFAPKVREQFSKLENEFIEQTEDLQRSYDGDTGKLKKFSMYANSESFQLAKSLLGDIKQKVNENTIDHLLVDYFKQAAESCGMEYSIKGVNA